MKKADTNTKFRWWCRG